MNDNQDIQANWIDVIALLETFKSKITEETDLLWTNYNSVQELRSEIDVIDKLLADRDKKGLQFLSYWFAPTGTMQEIAMQNDWIQEYLNLSLKFDTLYENLK
ncbi:hypothetical protein L1276_003325 [Flavobacterium sp. HSC-32F16]|uniref:hypothetical protein n=1 Tax=Flavobacterium sp. HSC-32F16 TaxID=2910964 RepID=UPI0020A5A2E7|nr:hypothetical protein [Flavobacterium sp. HSC-32F16]MCP2028157.1 hypothetical protein [Flavobacterium sp. HSC-32F16]